MIGGDLSILTSDWSRFPFFTELQWYALDKYVWSLLGKVKHLKKIHKIIDPV